MVPVDDFEAFVVACERLLADPGSAARGERGRRAAEAFSADTMIERYSPLFDGALSGRPLWDVRTELAVDGAGGAQPVASAA